MGQKTNTLAEEASGVALRQLHSSYANKLPRIMAIRKFRDLYNGKIPRQLKIRYNVPLPIFSGMIDTLQADLDDSLVLKFGEQDPADWKAVEKVNAYSQMESQSMRPGAMWNSKFRDLRQEVIMTGRGILKYAASNDGGFASDLFNTPFEDFYFENKGGGDLENHLFCGEGNIWKTKHDLEAGAASGLYDKEQVKKLVGLGAGSEYKTNSYWQNTDIANRFASLSMSSDVDNYVGEEMFQFVEWGLTLKGMRWYILLEAFTGIWVRFEKLRDINSSNMWPWMSCASHKDSKNFATKGFADDIYPISVAATDLFNEDMENRRRRNSGARAFDKDMFTNVKQLDEAQTGRDRLVMADTKGGTRRISEGIYRFDAPEINGTIDMLSYMEELAGRNYGVNEMQKGGDMPASTKVGVVYAQQGQVSQRLSFESQPFLEIGQQLGLRLFCGLKDYMSEPLAIKMLGEDGYQWDVLRRLDLNIKRDFEISVVSATKENKNNEQLRQAKMEALEAAAAIPPNANPFMNMRARSEHLLRNGGWKEAEISLLLDPNTNADKATVAETSAAIQLLMTGKVPPINYNATGYFMQKILDFVKTHQADPQIKKHYKKFLEYIMSHEQIAADNEKRRAQQDVQDAQRSAPPVPGGMPDPSQQPVPQDQSAPQLTPQQ